MRNHRVLTTLCLVVRTMLTWSDHGLEAFFDTVDARWTVERFGRVRDPDAVHTAVRASHATSAPAVGSWKRMPQKRLSSTWSRRSSSTIAWEWSF